MVVDNGNMFYGSGYYIYVYIHNTHGRGDPSMRVTIVRRRVLEKHIFLQDRKTGCPQESCVSPRRNVPWTEIRLVLININNFYDPHFVHGQFGLDQTQIPVDSPIVT